MRGGGGGEVKVLKVNKCTVKMSLGRLAEWIKKNSNKIPCSMFFGFQIFLIWKSGLPVLEF